MICISLTSPLTTPPDYLRRLHQCRPHILHAMSDKTSLLSRLGLEVGLTYEAIITTISPCGEYDAAPMGIKTEDGASVIISPFKAARTYRNLMATGEAVANFTDEPYLFLMTALKNGEPLSRSLLTQSKNVKAPRLASAESFLELQAMSVNESQERAVVICRPLCGEVVSAKSKPYCRGRFAALETVVHATRVRMFLEFGRSEEAEPLIQLIQHYRNLVHRVSSNSSYSLVVDRVDELIGQWRRNGLAEAK